MVNKSKFFVIYPEFLLTFIAMIVSMELREKVLIQKPSRIQSTQAPFRKNQKRFTMKHSEPNESTS